MAPAAPAAAASLDLPAAQAETVISEAPAPAQTVFTLPAARDAKRRKLERPGDSGSSPNNGNVASPDAVNGGAASAAAATTPYNQQDGHTPADLEIQEEYVPLDPEAQRLLEFLRQDLWEDAPPAAQPPGSSTVTHDAPGAAANGLGRTAGSHAAGQNGARVNGATAGGYAAGGAAAGGTGVNGGAAAGGAAPSVGEQLLRGAYAAEPAAEAAARRQRLAAHCAASKALLLQVGTDGHL